MKHGYKVIETRNAKKAAVIMNKRANEGWRVISNTYWRNFKAKLSVTFEKEVLER